MVSIPTAEVLNDGELMVGTAFYHKDYLNLYDKNYHGAGTYITIGFLPFVEVSFRITRLLNYPDSNTQGLGDRMPSIRIQLFHEGIVLPSLLFGAHDFVRSTESLSSYNTATYFVITKNFSVIGNKLNLKASAGQGVKILRSSNYQFEGFFYGLSLGVFKIGEIMIENDSKEFNGGIRVNIWNFSSTIGAMDMKYLSGTLSYSFKL